MSRQQQLNAYIDSVERRLRMAAVVRGSVVIAATALIVTVVTVLVLNAYAFPLHRLTTARLTILLAIVTAATIALVIPLLRLTRKVSVRLVEQAFPAFDDRLLTFTERQETHSGPFFELLASDTLAVAENSSPTDLVPQRTFYTLIAAGIASLGILLWMIAAGPGYLGYGASLLWTGPKKNAAPLYDLRVLPGNAALRRNTDQLITAQISGIQTDKVQLFARYQSTARWEPVSMRPLEGAPGYQFLFTALPENVEYYVSAGPLSSAHYTLRVVDMPQITGITVTYTYPPWTGMKSQVDEHGGDLRAIEGTTAALNIHTDKPLRDGRLALDDGTSLQLNGGDGNTYHTTLKMQKDGAYHIAGIDQGQQVRLTEDYFVATNKAEPPTVAIEKPTNDYHASPIEEVTVKVKGSAEFGLNAMALHYSVNGGPEQTVPMLKSNGLRQADGSQTLSLENFKMQPGDVVSLYATARDGHAESKTDISFIQADPFEREFSQSQAGGGGGGGGGGQQQNQGEISRRQKELIAQTWKQQNDKTATPKSSEDQSKFLADVQSKLRQQVDALSSRLESRDMTAANESFSSFEKDMQEASKAMIPATDKLRGQQWKDAIANEQKALQFLLRAEATFRQIQVAFGQRGGGGGGGGSMGRDLATLLDLELDTAKNQYESAQTSSPQEEKEKKVDEALQKLDALAKRQEELAQNERNNPQQSFQQRWQQEMLRREAEQLQKQMEQLAQNQNGQTQTGQQQSGQQNGTQSGQPSSSQSGQPSGSRSASASSGSAGQPSPQRGDDPRVQQALDRLRRANDEMRRAASPQAGQPNAQQAANEAARRAAESLRQATGLMGGAQQQQASGKLDSLAAESDRIAKEERAQSDRIRQFVAEQNSKGPATTMQEMMDRANARNRIADDRQKLSEDFSRLQNNLRSTARQLAPTQPGVSSKLRDALNASDQDGLDNRVQRTADWLRRGINPESNGTEESIRAGMDKLNQQVRQAANGIGSGNDLQQQRQNTGDQTAALGALDRFRNRIESLSNRSGNGQQRNSSGRPQGQNNQQGNGQRPGQRGQGQRDAGNQSGNGGQQNAQSGNAGAGGRTNSGDLGNSSNRGGGYDGGAAWGNLNTGNNQFDRSRHIGDPGDTINPADMQQIIAQGIRDLNGLRQAAGNDQQTKKEIDDLQRQMQNLDPRRFPGNPEMVQHISAEVLAQADKIELRLRQNGATNQGQVRSSRPKTAAPAYRDAVADYYRRLSKTQP